MRYVVLDTETTGIATGDGHRIIEIAAMEVVNRTITEKTFQTYVNPERLVDPEAYNVHGLSDEFLSDKPLFRDVSEELLEFVKGSEVVIHNAPFDVGFLNMELDKIGLGKFTDYCEGILDTLVMARRLHPGRRNSLDALCERYVVDRSARSLHGALIDTKLLAEVYLAMTRGQDSLLEESELPTHNRHSKGVQSSGVQKTVVITATKEESSRHDAYLKTLEEKEKIKPIWLK